jgi:hypothetical protein
VHALADNAAFWPLAILALILIYLLPTLIGLIRRVDALALVFLVNLIAAPTGIGWIAALVLALRQPRDARVLP